MHTSSAAPVVPALPHVADFSAGSEYEYYGGRRCRWVIYPNGRRVRRCW